MGSNAAGVPIWVDFSSPDLDKSTSFYQTLFDWSGQSLGPETGNYTMFRKNGKLVAGGGPTMEPDQHPAWSTYFQSDDAGATAEAVRKAGGTAVVEPMAIFDAGSMAVFRDPTGAFFSIWQPGQHTGAELVNEVGAFCWNELYTPDVPRNIDFYKQVFGWEVAETEMGTGAYWLFKVDGRDIAGGMDMKTVELPPEVPPHWLVYFTVADIEDTIAKVQQLGGQARGPMPTPMGPFAVVTDSVGAVFGAIQITGGES